MIKITVFTLVIFFPYLSQAQTPLSLIEKKDTSFISLDKTKVFAEEGVLKVPENRQNSACRYIPIKFIRLKSLSSTPATPLIYLEGGGDPSTGQAGNPITLNNWLDYLKVSDVILVDQRGSTDRDLLWIWDGPYPENFLVSEDAAGEHWKAMAAKALPAFRAKGIDITGYNMEESAKDIEALMKALNVEKYSILGFSNGSRLALTLINLYENKIENAVLAGVDGPDHAFNYPSDLDKHVGTIAQLVAQNKEINALIPDFTKLLGRVMKKFEKEPITIEVRNPLNGQNMRVKVGAFGLALALRLDIDDATDIPVMPKLLYALDQGDASMLKWFVQKRVVFAFAIPGNGLNEGIASGASNERLKRIEKEANTSLFRNVVNFPYYPVKEVWPPIKSETRTSQSKKSKVRTLFLSGDLDGRTPASQAMEIRRSFSKSRGVIVKNAGHEQILTNAEIRKIIPAFLAGKEIDTTINISNEPIKFIPLTGANNSLRHPAVTN